MVQTLLHLTLHHALAKVYSLVLTIQFHTRGEKTVITLLKKSLLIFLFMIQCSSIHHIAVVLLLSSQLTSLSHSQSNIKLLHMEAPTCSLSLATQATSWVNPCSYLRLTKGKTRKLISTASNSSVQTLLDNASIKLLMWAPLLTILQISILEVTPK